MKKNPENLLFFSGTILFVLSFIVFNQSIDIHLHDTYFVINRALIFRLLSITVFLIWVLYKVTSKLLFSNRLSRIHIIATLSAVGMLILFMYSGGKLLNPTPIRYFDYSNWDFNEVNSDYTKALLIFFWITMAAQITYVINLICGINKKRKKFLSTINFLKV